MITDSQEKIYQKQAEVVTALSHWVRIAILDFLKDGPQCVCHIAKHVGSERSNVSKHLSILVNADILDSHKDGLNVIYRLKTPCIMDFFLCIRTCLKERAKDNKNLLKSL